MSVQQTRPLFTKQELKAMIVPLFLVMLVGIGVALAMVLDWSVRAVSFWLRMKSGKWKAFRVV